jgi:TonB-linked SusC/RagA family outer membrane protein
MNVSKNFYFTLSLLIVSILANLTMLNAQINQVQIKDSSVILYKGEEASSKWEEMQPQLFSKAIQRNKSTAAIASIAGNDAKKVNTPLLGNTLMGQLSGLYVAQSGGAPGNTDFPSLFIRGRQTFQDNSILVLVDGFESNWFSLLPDEIATISVLKDAAALSQLGMDGANGAILITTKRGQESAKTNISFSSRIGVHSPRYLPQFVSNGDYADMYNQALIADGRSIRDGYFRTDSIVNFFKNQDYPFLYPDVNWYEEVIKNRSISQDYSLTFSGGRQDVKYFVAMGFADYQGIYSDVPVRGEINSNYNLKRYNLRANFDVKINSFLSAQANLRATMVDKYFPNIAENTIWRTMALFNPYPVKTMDGKWGGTQGYSDNPKASIVQKGYQSINDRTVDANFKLMANLGKIVKGLSAFAQVNFSNFFFDTYNKTRPLYYDELIPRLDLVTVAGNIPYNVVTRGTVDNNFSITQGNGSQFNRSTFLGGLEFERTSDKHDWYASAIYFQEQFKGDGADMPYAKQRMMGKIRYNYLSSYSFEFSYAYSGSENFPVGSRFGFFPTVSAGWTLSNAAFLKENKSISFLKLRASAGMLGNDNVGNAGRFIFNQYYVSTGSYLLGNNLGISSGMFNQGSLANPSVTWEKSNKLNVGLDIELLKKLSLTVEWFRESRSDIFLNPSSYIPALMGANFSSVNKGQTESKGYELEWSYKDSYGDLHWQFGGNFTHVKNKIIDISEPVQSDPYLVAKGNPINQPFVLEFAGFFRNQADINSSPTQLFGTVREGDIKYKDQNKDGVIDNRDRIPTGFTSLPQIFYGISSGLQYQGWDLFLSLQGIAERTISLLDNGTAIPFLNGGVKPLLWLKNNYWTNTRGDAASFPRLTAEQNDNNYRASTLWQRNGSLIRLQTIEIGYKVPDKWVRKAGMQSARFFFSGNNLITWQKLKETTIDAEVINPFVHPPMQSFNMGFTLHL